MTVLDLTMIKGMTASETKALCTEGLELRGCFVLLHVTTVKMGYVGGKAGLLTPELISLEISFHLVVKASLNSSLQMDNSAEQGLL